MTFSACCAREKYLQTLQLHAGELQNCWRRGLLMWVSLPHTVTSKNSSSSHQTFKIICGETRNTSCFGADLKQGFKMWVLCSMPNCFVCCFVVSVQTHLHTHKCMHAYIWLWLDLVIMRTVGHYHVQIYIVPKQSFKTRWELIFSWK